MNTQNAQPARPVITQAMRDQAAQQPNTWLYVVDPMFSAEPYRSGGAPIPPWAYIGGYRVDERGELTDDYSPNPHYRPSPLALGFPRPNNAVEHALQLSHTGYGSGRDLLLALLNTEVLVLTTAAAESGQDAPLFITRPQPQNPAQSGQYRVNPLTAGPSPANPAATGAHPVNPTATGQHPVPAPHQTGPQPPARGQVHVFTSQAELPQTQPASQRMTGRQLLARQPGAVDLLLNPASAVKARVPIEDLAGAAQQAPGQAVPPVAAPAPGLQSSSNIPAPFPPAQASGATGATGNQQVAGGPALNQPPAAVSPAATEQPASDLSTSDPVLSSVGQRFQGAMLTSAIGDALGSAVEFHPVEQIRNRYGSQGLTGYDKDSPHAGHFSDDTQLALFAAEGLIRGHIAMATKVSNSPLPAVQLALQRWLHTQGQPWPQVSGPFSEQHPEPTGWLVQQKDLFTTSSANPSLITALTAFAEGKGPGRFGHTLNESADCSGLVRSTSAALWSTEDQEVFELAAAMSALTTGHPNGYLPAGVHAVLIRRLLNGSGLLDALAHAEELLGEYSGKTQTARLLQAAIELASHGKPTAEQLTHTLGEGWTATEALAIAVASVLSTDSLNEALLVSVNHSGNSDTTGAVCGALAGAFYGRQAIPGVWLRDLHLAQVVENIAKDALVQFGPKPPKTPTWTERYPAEKDTCALTFASAVPRAEKPAEAVSTPDAGHGAGANQSSAGSGQGTAEDHSGQTGEARAATDSGSPTPPTTESAATESAAADSAATQAKKPDEFESQYLQAAGQGAEQHSRIHGMLLAAAVGDVVGSLFSPEALAQPRDKNELARMVDSPSPGDWISGNVQLALFTTDALIRDNIHYRQTEASAIDLHIEQSFRRWYRTWLARTSGGELTDDPTDGWLVGDEELTRGRGPDAVTLEVLSSDYSGDGRLGSLYNPINDSAEPGGIVHAVAASLCRGDTETFRVAALTAAITHGDPRGYLPAGVMAVVLRQLILGRPLPEAIQVALAELSVWEKHEGITERLQAAITMGTQGGTVQQLRQDLGTGAAADEALSIALCAALMFRDSVEDAIVFAARHSETNETTSAICGAMLGALHTPTGIPERWQTKPHAYPAIAQLSQDMARELSDSPPADAKWFERYPWKLDRPIRTTSVAAAKQTSLTTESSESTPGDSTQDTAVASEANAEVSAAPTEAEEAEAAEESAKQDASPDDTSPEASSDEAAAETATSSASNDSDEKAAEEAEPAAEAEQTSENEAEAAAQDTADTERSEQQPTDSAEAVSTPEESSGVDTASITEAADEPESQPADSFAGTGQSASDSSNKAAADDVSPAADPGAEQGGTATPITAETSEEESTEDGSAHNAEESTGKSENTNAATGEAADSAADAASHPAEEIASSDVAAASESDAEAAAEVPDETNLGPATEGADDSPSGSPGASDSDGDNDSATDNVAASSASAEVDTEESAAEPALPALDNEQRRAGCVLGLAVGDALGAPWMFTNVRGILRETAEGPKEFASAFGRTGGATAITQQTAFIFRQLITSEIRARQRGIGVYIPAVVQDGLKQWMRAQGAHFTATFSGQALEEYTELAEQRYPDDTTLIAIAQWSDRRETPSTDNPPNQAAGAAATARSGLLGFYADTPANALALGNEVAAITHGHRDGYLPAGAMAAIITALTTGHTLAEAVEAAIAAVDALDEPAEELIEQLRTAIELSSGNQPPTPADLEELGTGWQAGSALAIAVAAALSFPHSMADAVRLAATHSGHSAATAALCGCILGTALGEEAVPETWRAGLELGPVLEQLLNDKVRTAEEISIDGSTPAWAKSYLA